MPNQSQLDANQYGCEEGEKKRPPPMLEVACAEYCPPDSRYVIYDLCAATRGPDNSDNSDLITVKTILTTRVRGILFPRNNCAGMEFIDPVGPRGLQRVRDAMRNLRQLPCLPVGTRHFCRHLQQAIRKSEYHPIWGGYANELIDILSKRHPS